jgi:hypothetical protein
LTDALLAGERLLADYVEPNVEPNSDRTAIIDQLVHLSTARRQREAQRLAAEGVGSIYLHMSVGYPTSAVVIIVAQSRAKRRL